MLEKLFEHLAKSQEKYPVQILTVAFIITLFLGINAINLKTDASFDTLYGKESDHVQLKNLVSNEFGSTDTIYILVAIDDESDDASRLQDIRHPDVLNAIQILKRSILEEKAVAGVFTTVDLIEITYGQLPTSLEESKQFFDQIPWETKKDVLARDYSAASMVVQMNIPNKQGSLEKAEQIIKEKVDAALKPVGIKFVLSGEPILINRIMNLLINDNLKTVGIAIIFILLILIIYFRSGGIGFLTVIPLLLSLTWLSGTLVLLDIRITFMTAAVGSMMVGMGIDYAIHMTHSFLRNLKQGRTDASKIAVLSVGPALVASALTTIAGFLAMLFGVSPSSRIQGFVLSVGIFYAFVATIIVLPCLLILYKKLVYSDLDKAIFKLGTLEESKERSFIHTPLLKLAKLQTTAPKTILFVFVILTILILPGITRVFLDTSDDNWITPGDPVMAALEEIGNKFGGLSSQNFILMIDPDTQDEKTPKDLRDPKVLKKLHELDKAMEKSKEVTSFISPVDTILAANNNKIPQDIETIKNILNKYPRARNMFNKDYTLIKLTAIGDDFGGGGPGSSLESTYNEWLYEAESVNFPEGVTYFAQGGIRSDLELDNLLAVDTAKNTIIGFIFVFIIALLIYRSFVVGLLAIIPIIFAILWTVGIMGWVRLPFTVLTSGMMAIVMGMGIDFSIHLIHNTRAMLAKGKAITESIIYSVTTTGEAISVTTLTTVVGFSSLTLATLLVTRRLGLTLAIAVFSAFVICLLIVPATLVIEHNFKNRKRL